MVGSLTAVDQDTSQNHTFQLLNSASGRFKVDGNEIKVKFLKAEKYNAVFQYEKLFLTLNTRKPKKLTQDVLFF